MWDGANPMSSGGSGVGVDDRSSGYETTRMSRDLEPTRDVAARVDDEVRPHVEADDVLGLTWLVAVGETVERGALGHLDEDRVRPVTLDTIFRISSMTKPITAAAALVLVDEGTVGLDDPVDRWLPELADRRVLADPRGELDDTVPAARAITVDDLLTFRFGHGGDLSDWSPNPLGEALAKLGLGAGPPAPALPPEPDEWIRRLGTVPLQYQPGDRWLYHTGSDVLGVLIARASGRPFPEFLAERLFEPLGMPDTAFVVPAAKRDRFGATFAGRTDEGGRAVYDAVDGQWSTPPAFPGGGAGLVSTADDYFAFADMLRRNGETDGRRVLSASAVRTMTTNHLTPEQVKWGPTFDGGLGWGFGVGVRLRSALGHSAGSYGWDGGMGTTWFNDPERDLVAIMMTNEMWTSPTPPAICDSFYAAVDQLGR
jgi:CubicO group peptidase (beta-lactamase class C family)